MALDSWKRLYSNTPSSSFREIAIAGLWKGADVPNSPTKEVSARRHPPKTLGMLLIQRSRVMGSCLQPRVLSRMESTSPAIGISDGMAEPWSRPARCPPSRAPRICAPRQAGFGALSPDACGFPCPGR